MVETGGGGGGGELTTAVRSTILLAMDIKHSSTLIFDFAVVSKKLIPYSAANAIPFSVDIFCHVYSINK
jgi:hypothetical protein